YSQLNEAPASIGSGSNGLPHNPDANGRPVLLSKSIQRPHFCELILLAGVALEYHDGLRATSPAFLNPKCSNQSSSIPVLRVPATFRELFSSRTGLPNHMPPREMNIPTTVASI
ncbi:MAG TPA: hypothetical protein VMQ76_07780, partial [Terracidiphilus sp.]|nr:hypothetical protein [Terracidiphilus sp.]